MGARVRIERRESLDESQRIEGDGRRAAAPGTFVPVDDAAIGCERKALRSDQRASHIAAQMLESLELAGGHEHLGRCVGCGSYVDV